MAEVPDAGSSRIDVDPPSSISAKLTILPGYSSDLSAATFCLNEEDHTLGNSLRWMLMKDPEVEFCGYSIPHPSDTKTHLRIQMYDSISVLPALRRALVSLSEVFTTIGEQYQTALDEGGYEKYEEKVLDKAWLEKFKHEGIKKKAEEDKVKEEEIAAEKLNK